MGIAKSTARLLAQSALLFTAVVSAILLIRKACPHVQNLCSILYQIVHDATLTNGIAFLLLGLLYVVQAGVHALDKQRAENNKSATPAKGLGIAGRHRWMLFQATEKYEQATTKDATLQKQIDAKFHETDKGAIRAFMTKQSIFAALTLFLLKAVSAKLPPALPQTLTELLYVLAGGGFLLTLLIVLVAIQTYSTYVRFQWDEKPGNALLKKGRQLDEWSFYLMSFSLLVALSAYQPWVALIVIPVFGTLMYKYYFFSMNLD